MISIIVAVAKNRVIGNNNSLLWKLPADLKHFRILTQGRPIIMGRKTFESIGRPLPDRKNIVITSDKNFALEGCIVVHSINEALKAAGNAKEVMVIGGGEIYKQFLPMAQRMYITWVDAEFEGNVYFPEFRNDEWEEVEREAHEPDDKNQYPYTFVTLERK